MKKITFSMLMFVAAMIMVSCSDDDDNNSEKRDVTWTAEQEATINSLRQVDKGSC